MFLESLTDLGMDDEGDDDPVPLPNVNAAILKKVQNSHTYDVQQVFVFFPHVDWYINLGWGLVKFDP